MAVSSWFGESHQHEVIGDEIPPERIENQLAVSLINFVVEHGGRDAALNATLKIADDLEAVVLTFATSAPQEPAYTIKPSEKVVIFFWDDAAPLVVPLRVGFPVTPHSYGLPMEIPTSAPMTMCIDDRPWDDARGDYSGPELIRRILSWFDRTGSGEVNDALQAPDFAFLPSPFTIMMPAELDQSLVSEDKAPIFVALRSPEPDAKLFQAIAPEDIAESPGEGMEWITYVGMALQVEVDNRGAMWRAPTNLGHLRDSIGGAENDILQSLRQRIIGLLRDAEDELQKLYESKLMLRVFIRNVVASRIESFCLLTEKSVGEMGVALGLLWPPNVDAGATFTSRFPVGDLDISELAKISLVQANFYTSFEQREAALFSGRGENWRRELNRSAVILGAGSIGSQVMDSMVREGAFCRLAIVDDDHLAPHNLARHSLRFPSVGQSKARHLAAELNDTRPDLPVDAFHEKLGGGNPNDTLGRRIDDADFVLDMTASVGASRRLSDLEGRGRAACAFFNPMGNAVVILVEDEDRGIDLAALEALYYAEIIDQPDLHGHLQIPNVAVIGGGQCRATTNRMSSSNAAILSGIAADRLGTALARPNAKLAICTIREDGSISAHSMDLSGKTEQFQIDDWTVRVTESVIDRLRMLRRDAAPDETGGVLLGIVDHARRRIEVAIGLSAPIDSTASPTSFERGVRDLRDSIDTARLVTMDQCVYLGEWHTHPDNTRTDPSPVDRTQLSMLRGYMSGEQRPVLMLIVGEQEATLIAAEVPQ